MFESFEAFQTRLIIKNRLAALNAKNISCQTISSMYILVLFRIINLDWSENEINSKQNLKIK